MLGGVNENKFQSQLIRELKGLFDGCIITKLDSGHKQGIPDLLILFGSKWATLEVKKEKGSSHRPNQDWYVNKMNSMSFSSFIYPENKNEILQNLILFFDGKERTDVR